MTGGAHTIGVQKVEVVFSDRRQGVGLQNELSRICREELLAEMEQVLNLHDTPAWHLQIERIEIDAGVLSSDNWERELVERTAALFRAQLDKLLLSPLPRFPAPGAIPRPGLVASSVAERSFEQWLGFLRTGLLDGPTTGGGLRGLEAALMQGAELWQSSGQRANLMRVLLLEPQVLERLVLQSCELFLVHLLTWLQGSEAAAKNQAAVYTNSNNGEKLMRISKALFAVAYSEPLFSAEDLIVAEKIIASKPRARFDADQLRVTNVPEESKPGADRQASGKGETLQAGGSIFIQNAGLVLLNPFLPALFTSLGLIDSARGWINPAAHQRAVLLLQYLATGGGDMAEHRLPLNKLLCGFPLARTLEPDFSPTVQEEKECQILLDSVIRHWTVLKNTGVAALRQTFLQREAKISFLEKGWKMQVAQQPFDMLLTHLPWTISRVRTPWMDAWLQTEWT